MTLYGHCNLPRGFMWIIFGLKPLVKTLVARQFIHFFGDPSPILMKFGKLGGLQKKLMHTKFQLISIILMEREHFKDLRDFAGLSDPEVQNWL